MSWSQSEIPKAFAGEQAGEAPGHPRYDAKVSRGYLGRVTFFNVAIDRHEHEYRISQNCPQYPRVINYLECTPQRWMLLYL